MKRVNVVRDKVFAAADSLRKQSIVPTTLNIRAMIGGSQTTASKYLREWRELYDCETEFSPKQMQLQLTQQRQINENLTIELLNSNNTATMQMAEIAQLRDRCLELEARLNEKNQACQEITVRFLDAETNLKSSFDSMIAILTDQIRSINEHSINKIQAAGQYFDDQVIELRLEVRELKEQISLKDREIKKLKEQLTDTTLKGKNYV